MSQRNGQHEDHPEDSTGPGRAKRFEPERHPQAEGEATGDVPGPDGEAAPLNGHAADASTDGNQPPKPGSGKHGRSLSEISHLFLSELRSNSGHGRAPPKRIPPGQRHESRAPPSECEVSVDLTHDEFEGEAPEGDPQLDESDYSIPPVAAVIGARLNGKLIRRACQYASGLAQELPVGLLIVEADGVRLIWVAQGETDEDAIAPERTDCGERLRAAILEMSCDIARWLVVLPDPRLPQARRLLAAIREWVLLTPADHDGVVSSYRVLKGLCDLELPDDETDAPHVTLALVDADDAAEAQRHARKLVGVCRQFLDLEIEPANIGPVAGAVSSIGDFAVREVLRAAWPRDGEAEPTLLEDVLLPMHRPARAPAAESSNISSEQNMSDSTRSPRPQRQQAARGHDAPVTMPLPDIAIPAMARPAGAAGFFAEDWLPSGEDLSRLGRRSDLRGHGRNESRSPEQHPVRRHIQDIEIPDVALPIGAPREWHHERRPQIAASAPGRVDATVGPKLVPPEASDPGSTASSQHLADDEVIDLPSGGTVTDVVLARLGLAETAICPPMLPTAKLCISRDGAIVLVAAASPGLDDLPSVGRAISWASENRALLRMALSQYRLDASAEVRLHLLVSRADANAEALRPLMSTGRVNVQAYRRLTWGGRCGLLLEAA